MHLDVQPDGQLDVQPHPQLNAPSDVLGAGLVAHDRGVGVARADRGVGGDVDELPAHTQEHGFTLIELMVVIVVIGILAAIAILHLSPLKDQAYTASLVTDLRNLETAEEAYFVEYATYTPSLPTDSYTPTTGNTYQITSATVTGWSAVVTTSHSMVSRASSCHIASGSAATTNGEYPGTTYCP